MANGKGREVLDEEDEGVDEMPEDIYHEDFRDEEGFGFADPGGRSALRAASKSNPRNRPCPTCGRKNALTPRDVQLHYQCDRCADAAEGIGFGGEY